MKKILAIGLFAFLSLTSLQRNVFAQSIPRDFEYRAYANSITITKYTGNAGIVSIPAEIEGLPVTEIYSYIFWKTSITSVTIPNSVTSIGTAAFADCTSLTSVTIPNSVTEIGNYAFSNCSSLASITIPNRVTEIGDGAFRGCTSLTSITIPSSVTHIGGEAFRRCISLTSITIPSSVTHIRGDAFAECTSLTSVTFQGRNTYIEASSFPGNLRDLRDVYIDPGTYTRIIGGQVWRKQ